MKRKIIVGLLATVLLTSASLADAEQTKKIPRIGWLAGNLPYTQTPRLEVLRRGLRELGYIEGKDVMIEARYNQGKLDQLPELAAELVRLNVDLIVAVGTQAAQAAKSATSSQSEHVAISICCPRGAQRPIGGNAGTGPSGVEMLARGPKPSNADHLDHCRRRRGGYCDKARECSRAGSRP